MKGMLNSIDTSENASIASFIDQILKEAIDKQASDIHFEPYSDFYRIRFRIDGILYEKIKTPLLFAQQFSTYLKIMANLDISEKRLPQDGRFSLNKNYDCRLSTCPTSFGEKLVVRILNPRHKNLNISHLNFNHQEEKIFSKHIQMPQGMILVTGPTGSGKTITLYTAINAINEIAKNISTVEDPIEISLNGINQVEINYKLGLNFSKILRTFLRQDPDVIMVGEIRDTETAQIAIKAAHTGHLVLSTLHTNSAATALNRLINIGIPTFNLATAVNLIVAQRLIRKLCVHCKKIIKPPASTLLEHGLEKNCTIYTATGCKYCNKGYYGRTAVFEMLPITPSIRELIMKDCSIKKISSHMKQLGYPTLKESATNKVRSGITSLEEINRVITQA